MPGITSLRKRVIRSKVSDLRITGTAHEANRAANWIEPQSSAQTFKCRGYGCCAMPRYYLGMTGRQGASDRSRSKEPLCGVARS